MYTVLSSTGEPRIHPGACNVIAVRARQVAVVAATVSRCLLAAHGAAAGDAAAGARLATVRCVSCHSSTETIHSIVPLLEGQPKSAFIAQWRAFKNRTRTAPVMVGLADELSERDADDLAEYYAGLPPPRATEMARSEAGRALADRLQCSDCHGAALRGTDAGAPRLAGQKAKYTAWSLALMRSGARPHGSAAKPDPLLAGLSNAEIELLAAYLAALR
jgi:cytochrome c553